MANILRIDASWDTATLCGSFFRNKFIFDNFQERWPTHKITEFIGESAQQPNLDNHLGGVDVHYITGMGHGLYNTFAGYQNKVIWPLKTNGNYNIDLLWGRVVHLVSCRSGALLGQWMVKQGVLAFWGYATDFEIRRGEEYTGTDEYNDPTAEIFMRMDIIIDIGILSGKTAHQIYTEIEEYVLLVIPQIKEHLRRPLLNNFYHIVCPLTNWGNPDIFLPGTNPFQPIYPIN